MALMYEHRSWSIFVLLIKFLLQSSAQATHNPQTSRQVIFFLYYSNEYIALNCVKTFCIFFFFFFNNSPLEWETTCPPACHLQPPPQVLALTTVPVGWLWAVLWQFLKPLNKWLSPMSTSHHCFWVLMTSGSRQKSWHVKAAVRTKEKRPKVKEG